MIYILLVKVMFSGQPRRLSKPGGCLLQLAHTVIDIANGQSKAALHGFHRRQKTGFVTGAGFDIDIKVAVGNGMSNCYRVFRFAAETGK